MDKDIQNALCIRIFKTRCVKAHSVACIRLERSGPAWKQRNNSTMVAIVKNIVQELCGSRGGRPGLFR